MNLNIYLVAQIANLHPNFHTLLFTHSEYLEVEVALAPICLSMGHFGIHSSSYPNRIHRNVSNLSQMTMLDNSC